MLTFAPAACTPPAASPPPSHHAVLPRDLAGCYELHRTKSLYYAPPRLRLDSTAAFYGRSGPVRDSAWQLVRLDTGGRAIVDERRSPILFWKAASADSIRIVISTGYSGSELVVGQGTGDTLQGRATEFWDMGPSENDGGAVTLVRIPCVEPG